MNPSPKPVLIAGATGFIGQRLQASLLGAGRKITALVRPGSRHKSRILPSCGLFEAALTDNDSVASAVSDSDAVIYCAGSVRGRRLEDFSAANIDGVRSMAEAMNRCAPDIPFLLISSLAASRLEVSDYARSKYEGELMLARHAQFPWAILRPPAVYGPGDKEMLPILKLARRGIVTPAGPAGQKLSLLHADDLCTAVISWLNSWQHCREQTYSIDDGYPGGYDWRTIAETASGGRYHALPVPQALLFGAARANMLLSRLFAYAPMLTPGKARELTQEDWICDNTSFTLATGWEPSISLRQGLQTLFGARGESGN